MMKKNEKEVSRRRFLQILGSVIAGGSLVGFSAAMFKKTESKGFPIGEGAQAAAGAGSPPKPTSPYKLVSAFEVPDSIEAFELSGDRLVVAIPNSVMIYDEAGGLQNAFAIGSGVRDVAVQGGLLYLLFASRVEVYDMDGAQLREWEACSAGSDYCSMAVAGESVFVTDAANKNICKYTTDGGFVKIIESPDRFIIPSYSFGITHADGVLYCSNSGRHKVESYTLDGEYLGSFGKTGGAEGAFGGCCNPVHLTSSRAGELITSEKGVPRVSCYGADGKFRSVLLDAEALGRGTGAADVKIAGERLFVAGRDRVSVFRYDQRIAARTACGDCGVECPLRTGTMI